MVTTGLITVFIWDTLVFDKRDAMVLGPLPVPGRTVVFAKLAALATFLLGAALLVNLTSGMPFGLVTGGKRWPHHQTHAGHIRRHDGGAVFIFSTLVIVRGLLVLLVGPQFSASIGSALQFVFLSGVLCFMMVPTAMGRFDAGPFSTRARLNGCRSPGSSGCSSRSGLAGAWDPPLCGTSADRAAVGRGRRGRRDVCGVLETDARGARAICARGGERSASPRPGPRADRPRSYGARRI
jgi:hypothetical protein